MCESIGANQTLQNGKCVNKTPKCGANQILQNGRCVNCLIGTKKVNNHWC